jgi:hypothetical protein
VPLLPTGVPVLVALAAVPAVALLRPARRRGRSEETTEESGR